MWMKRVKIVFGQCIYNNLYKWSMRKDSRGKILSAFFFKSIPAWEFSISFFFLVFSFVLTFNKSWNLQIIRPTWSLYIILSLIKANPLPCTQVIRNVFKDNNNFFFSYVLIIFYIIKVKSYQLLLLSRSHEHLHKELDELIVIYSFVTVGVNLLDQSHPKKFWEV